MKDEDLSANGGWVTQSPMMRRLAEEGYSVGGYIDDGVPKYVLYRRDGHKFERIHEFDTAVELNNMVKLLLPKEG